MQDPVRDRTLADTAPDSTGAVASSVRLLNRHSSQKLISIGSVFGKRDLLAFFHVMKTNLIENTLSNAANHLKIFLIEFEIWLYKHLYFLYIRQPLFPIVVFISMVW